MSETYPKKDLCETLFAGHISLQRRIRGAKVQKICEMCKKNHTKMRFLWWKV